MSEAKSLRAARLESPTVAVSRAVLELFELLVANGRDRGDNVANFEAWADEHKPMLEGVLRGRTK